MGPVSNYLNEDNDKIIVSQLHNETRTWPVLIEKLDSNYRTYFSEIYLDNMGSASLTHSSRDERGNLYISNLGCYGENCYSYRAWLAKISTEGELLWQRTYGSSAWNQPTVPWPCVVNDTTIAYSWTRDTSGVNTQQSPPVIYYLDTLGNKRDSFTFHGNLRTARRIIPTADGGVIGVGFAFSNELNYSGWLFRLDANADLVWERYIQDHRQSTASLTDLECAAEMDDGSIVAGGDIFHPLPPLDGGGRLRGWLVKLDADGCLEPGCASDTIHLLRPTSVGEPDIAATPDLTLWPNPVVDELHWELPDLPVYARVSDYRITNLNGQIVRQGAVTAVTDRRIDVRELPAGGYVLSLWSAGKVRGVGKFVK